jgi:type II secretory pathway predicted ATPase ExeA
VEHLHHFDLSQDPFQNEPDLRFFCPSETHRRARLRVDRALRQMKGLVVLAGEGGTGKSLLARSMFEELEEEMFESCLLIMMQGTADAVSVLRRFCGQLGVEEPPRERPDLLGTLYEQLAIVREDGRHAVLIVDDAHILGRDAMAEIGGLLNLEYEDRRLLSMLLVGLPVLDETLASIPSLAERIDVHVRLGTLSEGESATYLAHRLKVAGGSGPLLDASAVKAIYTLGAGRPRRMNTLADNALFEAFLAGRTQVTEDDVRRAAADLPHVTPTPTPQPRTASVCAPAPEPSFAEGADPADPTGGALDLDVEPFSAATEVAFDAMEQTFDAALPAPAPVRPMPEPPAAHEPPGRVPEPQPGAARPEPTQLMDEADPLGDSMSASFSMSGQDLDLASLLGDDDPNESRPSLAADDGMEELQLDHPIAPEAAPDDSFPSFQAESRGAPMAEPTRLALAEDDPFERREPAAETLPPSDTDEIDDLFVELLED